MYLDGENGCDRPMKRHLAIDGQDEASFGESVLLIDDRPIANERSRCDFVT